MSAIKLNITQEALDSTGGGDYTPVPEGSYNATVYEVKQEEVRSGDNAGKPRFNVQFRLTGPGVENRRVFSYVPLYVAKDFWKTKAFFSSLGIDMEAGTFTVPSADSLAGKPIGVRVKIGTDMEGKPRNEVAGFDAPTNGADAALASIGAKPVGDVW